MAQHVGPDVTWTVNDDIRRNASDNVPPVPSHLSPSGVTLIGLRHGFHVNGLYTRQSGQEPETVMFWIFSRVWFVGPWDWLAWSPVCLSLDPMLCNQVDFLGIPVKFGSTEVREERLVAVNPVNPALRGQPPRQQYNICA